LKRRTEKHRLPVGRQLFVAQLPVFACPKCGESYADSATLCTFERAVARHLAEHGPATGETFRFMRKAIALPAREVAGLLSTTPETVSRWETGARTVDRTAWTTLSALVLDELDGGRNMRERLQALNKKPGRGRREIRLKLAEVQAR
jgi:YgiT-type zinc finger domain-containing protein